MKTFYCLLAVVLTTAASTAQTLTATSQNPVAGDIHFQAYYDTVAAIPKNMGLNQHWDFSTLVLDTTFSTTFIQPSSAPGASHFTAATAAETYTFDGDDTYSFYANTAAKSELLGFYINNSTPQEYMVYSDPMTFQEFPFFYGNSFADTFAGQFSSANASAQGTVAVSASGTGTITLPGGNSYANILQVKTSRHLVQTFTDPIFGTSTFDIKSTIYEYYEPSQRFPLLMVSVDTETDDAVFYDTTVTVVVNRMITTGIQDRNFGAQYDIYPNPAKDNFLIKLSNAANAPCRVEIVSASGQIVKNLDLGSPSAIESKVGITGLAPGIYVVRTTLGARQSSRRLIIE